MATTQGILYCHCFLYLVALVQDTTTLQIIERRTMEEELDVVNSNLAVTEAGKKEKQKAKDREKEEAIKSWAKGITLAGRYQMYRQAGCCSLQETCINQRLGFCHTHL